MEAQHAHEITKRERQQQAILESLAHGATRSAACRAANLARRTLYNWMDHDPAFREQVEDAEIEAVEHVESIAYTCATMAADDPRYQRSMLAFLKAKSPAWGARSSPQPEPDFQPEPEPEPVDPATYAYAPYGPPRVPPEYKITEPDVIALRDEMENGPPEKQQPRGSIGYIMAHDTLLRQRLIARLDAIWFEHTERCAREGNPVPRPDLPDGFHSPVLYLIRKGKHSPYDAAKRLGIPLPEKPCPPLPTWPPPDVRYPYRYAELSPNATEATTTPAAPTERHPVPPTRPQAPQPGIPAPPRT